MNFIQGGEEEVCIKMKNPRRLNGLRNNLIELFDPIVGRWYIPSMDLTKYFLRLFYKNEQHQPRYYTEQLRD